MSCRGGGDSVADTANTVVATADCVVVRHVVDGEVTINVGDPLGDGLGDGHSGNLRVIADHEGASKDR